MSASPLIGEVQRVRMSGIRCEGGVQERFLLEYPFRFHDGGRLSSRRPKQSNDCTVRALAIARELPYDEAYDTLAAAGRKCARGFHFAPWATRQPYFRKHAFQAVKGQSRMNVAKFCETHPQGRWVVRTAKHVLAVVDGVAHDIFESDPNRCVYTAWEVL